MKLQNLQTTCVMLLMVLTCTHGAFGTISIPANTTVGNWNSFSRVFTLTVNLNESVVIDEDSLTFDGAGHTITGPGFGNGVLLSQKTAVTVRNCQIHGFTSGVFLDDANGNTVTDNLCSSNQLGIFLLNAHGNTVTQNVCNSNYNGVRVRESDNNVLADNTVNLNSDDGFLLFLANNNTLEGNTASGNSQTAFSMRDSIGNVVTNNAAMGNARGVVITSAGNNVFTENTFSNSAVEGLAIVASSDNQVYNNNFINNAIQASVSTSSYNNVFNLPAPVGGNYWSDWTGPDNDEDGFADSPYVILRGRDDLPWVERDGWLVRTPQELLLGLVGGVIGLNLQQGINNSLDAKLDAALSALDDLNANNDVAAVNALEAFVSAVEAQRGSHISEVDADTLITGALNIISLLAGP